MALPNGLFRFKVIKKIGEGGLGLVEEIEITESNSSHPVGLRLARKRLGPQWASQTEARKRFEREIAALQKMRHPNIITVKGQDIGDGERFYCMPLCEKSFRTLLLENPQGFQWPSVARLGITLANALSHAHELGHFHRDIKPENILQDRLGNFLICDWGIGYFIHEQSRVLTKLTVAGGMGTEYYCSLEQWAGHGSTPAMDIYALGMFIAEAAMGHRIDLTMAGTGIQIDVVPQHSTAAKKFNSVIRKMTQMSPANRYSNMRDVITALEEIIFMNELNI